LTDSGSRSAIHRYHPLSARFVMCRSNLIVFTIREADLSKRLGVAGLRVQTSCARLLLPGDRTMKSEFRSLPSVDKLISDERIKDLEASYSHPFVVEVVRQILEETRTSISRGEPAPSSVTAFEHWRNPASDR
jgi:hypothetical protein